MTVPVHPATPDRDDFTPLVCVMAFNANDPSGAGGIAADIGTVVSVGAHALPVVTGAYAGDTASVLAHFALDDDAVNEQARVILEDVLVQAFKAGFVGSPENLATVAELASDYADIPLVTYMPDLSWWREDQQELYLDACKELLLPLTTVLVGNHNVLARWLLPDWNAQRSPSARDLAQAASAHGVSYTLVTGIPLPDQFLDNVLATPNAVVCSRRSVRMDALFAGAGDTLSAALAALLAGTSELAAATAEALNYLERCLENGFRPGMGNVLPDRLFWARPEASDDFEESAFEISPHDTRH